MFKPFLFFLKQNFHYKNPQQTQSKVATQEQQKPVKKAISKTNETEKGKLNTKSLFKAAPKRCFTLCPIFYHKCFTCCLISNAYSDFPEDKCEKFSPVGRHREKWKALPKSAILQN